MTSLPLLIAAPTEQRGRDYVRFQGVIQAKVVSTALGLRGMRPDVIVALDRSELAADLERDLSMMAQNGSTVINVNSDPLRQAPPDILAVALAERGTKAYRVRSAIKNEDFIVTVTKADTYALPEFATAEEALEFLETVEQHKAARERAQRERAEARAQGGYG